MGTHRIQGVLGHHARPPGGLVLLPGHASPHPRTWLTPTQFYIQLKGHVLQGAALTSHGSGQGHPGPSQAPESPHHVGVMQEALRILPVPGAEWGNRKQGQREGT